MRLAFCLLYPKLPRGNIFSGKHRLVKRVSKNAIETLKKNFELEEKNLFYLRHPYLTSEQSHGHGKALNKPKERMQSFKEMPDRKFEKHRTLADELVHLKTTSNWEFKAGTKIE